MGPGRLTAVASSLPLLLVILVGAVGSSPHAASARATAPLTGQITWVQRKDGVKLGTGFLHTGGTEGGYDGINGKQYTLHPGQPIRVMRGRVQFKVQLGQSHAYCETRESRGFLTVNPSPQVLLDFRGGASVCGVTGTGNCIRIATLAKVNLGASQPRLCTTSSSRVTSSASVTTQPTVIAVVVKPRSAVVKVKRGVATVSGATGARRAVVVSSNGRSRAQQVIVPSNGSPTRPAPTQLTMTDVKTFAQLAAELPPNRDLRPPPPPTLLKRPSNPSMSREAIFVLAPAAAGTVTSCALGKPGGMFDFRLCTGTITYPVEEGAHTFRVRATDAAGNTGRVRSYTWRVDVTPPTASIEGPPSPTATHDATLTFSASESATFACSLDHADATPCSSPTTYPALDSGRHTFTVAATDRAGNVGLPASYSWTIERPPPTPIAFESNRDGNYEIYVINPDGSGAMRLTNDPYEDVDPAWSPDGKRIAFESTRDTHTSSEIYVMNADGSAPIRLTTNTAIDRDPKWSPFGDRIAFESNRDGDYEIYVMKTDGTEPTPLTMNGTRDADPAWSPDGTHIAFESDRDGNGEIYVMDADGSNQTPLTKNPAEDSNPVWSPDGKRIAFESDRDGDHEIYVMDADGTDQTPLTVNTVRDSDPAWSPDGSRIAFASERDGNLEIYVMNADGTDPRRLTNSPFRDLVPNW